MLQQSSNYQVCRPKTSEHRRGMKWLTSLARTLERGEEPDVDTSLTHSMQFYSIYAETGDDRYLEMCEDFLRLTLEVAPKAR